VPAADARDAFAAAVALRDAARAHILRHCGESDLQPFEISENGR